MIFGEGPIIKNIAGDLNKLFLQGTRAGQPINNVEGDAAADQATVQLMADRDPVIRDISTGLGWAGREVTVSGTGALQLVNSLGRPLKSWSVELAPFQEGSGDPSPENVRPIHGTDKLVLWTSGKNLLGINEAYGDSSTITITDGVAIGTNSAFNNSRVYVPSQLVGKRLTWSVKVSVPATLTRVYTSVSINGRSINGSDIMSGTTGISTVSFTPTSTNDYFVLTYGSGNGTLTVSDFQLEFGSTATDYVAYAASQTAITLPYTIYNGIVGIDGGENRSGIKIFTGRESYSWGTSTTYGNLNYISLRTIGINDAKIIETSSYQTTELSICSHFSRMQGNTWIEEYSTNNRISFSVSRDSYFAFNVGEPINANVWLANQYDLGTPLQLVYTLDAPVQFSLTAPIISPTQGEGSIWVTAEDGIVTNFSATYLQGE